MKTTVTLSLDGEVKDDAMKVCELRGQKLSSVVEIYLKKYAENNNGDPE